MRLMWVIIYLFSVNDIKKKFAAAQLITVEFRLKVFVPEGIIGYASVVTNKLVSISSVGQKDFDFL